MISRYTKYLNWFVCFYASFYKINKYFFIFFLVFFLLSSTFDIVSKSFVLVKSNFLNFYNFLICLLNSVIFSTDLSIISNHSILVNTFFIFYIKKIETGNYSLMNSFLGTTEQVNSRIMQFSPRQISIFITQNFIHFLN